MNAAPTHSGKYGRSRWTKLFECLFGVLQLPEDSRNAKNKIRLSYAEHRKLPFQVASRRSSRERDRFYLDNSSGDHRITMNRVKLDPRAPCWRLRDTITQVAGSPGSCPTRKVTCFKAKYFFSSNFLKILTMPGESRESEEHLKKKIRAGLVGAFFLHTSKVSSMLSLWDAPFLVIFSGLVEVQDGVRSP